MKTKEDKVIAIAQHIITRALFVAYRCAVYDIESIVKTGYEYEKQLRILTLQPIGIPKFEHGGDVVNINDNKIIPDDLLLEKNNTITIDVK